MYRISRSICIPWPSVNNSITGQSFFSFGPWYQQQTLCTLLEQTCDKNVNALKLVTPDHLHRPPVCICLHGLRFALLFTCLQLTLGTQDLRPTDLSEQASQDDHLADFVFYVDERCAHVAEVLVHAWLDLHEFSTVDCLVGELLVARQSDEQTSMPYRLQQEVEEVKPVDLIQARLLRLVSITFILFVAFCCHVEEGHDPCLLAAIRPNRPLCHRHCALQFTSIPTCDYSCPSLQE